MRRDGARAVGQGGGHKGVDGEGDRGPRLADTRVASARAAEAKSLGGGEAEAMVAAEERRGERGGGDRRGGKREAMMLDSRPLRRVVAHAGWRTFYGRAGALWA